MYLTGVVDRESDLLMGWAWLHTANVAVLMSLGKFVLIENDFLSLGRNPPTAMECIGEAFDCAVIVQIGTILIGNLRRRRGRRSDGRREMEG